MSQLSQAQQAGQLQAVAKWLADERRAGEIEVVARGPRASLAALVAAASFDRPISALRLVGSYGSLHEVLEQVAGPGVTVGLEGQHQAAAGEGAAGGERRNDRRSGQFGEVGERRGRTRPHDAAPDVEHRPRGRGDLCPA